MLCSFIKGIKSNLFCSLKHGNNKVSVELPKKRINKSHRNFVIYFYQCSFLQKNEYMCRIKRHNFYQQGTIRIRAVSLSRMPPIVLLLTEIACPVLGTLTGFQIFIHSLVNVIRMNIKQHSSN